MSPDDFDYLARLLRRRSGMVLARGKADMLRRRLTIVMHRYGFRDLRALVADVRLGHEALADAIAEAMTINETSFFRDPAQFARLEQDVLPRLIKARGAASRLRIWSAACAAGQEAWSIAMLLDETGLGGWRIDLIATDFSTAEIARAAAGRYGMFEVQRGLNAARRARHFRAEDGEWVVADHLRRMARFRRFNLLDSYGWLDEVDIVFCRNVLMYFDAANRAGVVERMADTLAPDGVLLVGESENAEPMPAQLRPWPGAHGIYLRTPQAALKAG